jgi:hypothetical protein
MEVVALQNHIGMPVEIDVCNPCHLIWFDHLESVSLSAGSVIEMFKRIHTARDETWNIVGMQPACPICSTKLAGASDLARGGRFTYQRCVNGHGRLIAFTQFLREKNFIRSLQPHEIKALSVKIKQVRCSSCGAGVNIENDSACRHCGSPVSVLDEAAVEKALGALHAKEVQRTTFDPARMGEALTMRQPQRAREISAAGTSIGASWGDNVSVGAGLADLVEIGIGAALSAWFD